MIYKHQNLTIDILFHSSSPCASVMQLADWKDAGTSLVQDQPPLLLKSTIKCNYDGVDIKITDCGQRNEPRCAKSPDFAFCVIINLVNLMHFFVFILYKKTIVKPKD